MRNLRRRMSDQRYRSSVMELNHDQRIPGCQSPGFFVFRFAAGRPDAGIRRHTDDPVYVRQLYQLFLIRSNAYCSTSFQRHLLRFNRAHFRCPFSEHLPYISPLQPALSDARPARVHQSASRICCFLSTSPKQITSHKYFLAAKLSDIYN